VVLDLLSVGVDPKKSTMYLQSGVPAVYDLAVLLQMLIPTARLRALTTVRDMARAAGLEDETITMGLLGYPVLQAADILMARAEIVPVGRDNVEHVNVARELASSFNELYGEVFPVPDARISHTPALPGVHTGAGKTAAKMSKSLGNAIYLKDAAPEVERKLATLADAADDAALRQYVDAFVRDEAENAELKADLESGRRTRAATVDRVRSAIEAVLEPIRARRAEIAHDGGLLEEIIVDGTIRAREVAYQTLQQVREAMGLETLWRSLVDATQRRAEARKRPH
jgi:tryptophanyl-tRNA synthetase